MIVGGVEVFIIGLILVGFCVSKVMMINDDLNIVCRLFDLEWNGFILGEGFGVFVIEEFEYVLSRGVNIIVEIVGYGCINDVYYMIVLVEGGEGVVRCMKLVIDDVGVDIFDIGYINVYGILIKVNDKGEIVVVKFVFGKYVYEFLISLIKLMIGYLLGVLGVVEVIIIVFVFKEGFLFLIINYKILDFECDLNYVFNKGKKLDFIYVLMNFFGFGGYNVMLVLKVFSL